jgi:phenylalanine-4-hydroxylase
VFRITFEIICPDRVHFYERTAMTDLPNHLRKYIVEQNYQKYTPVDQACWRFILRQLRAFLSEHAHESYLDGLEKTGIEIEQIPRISEISKKLEKFGWRALPVSGFIPPAAFMELQSMSVLPIASDMRTIDHLMYTPAPDIVHEAAGHAPILANPEFAEYLKQYAQVAKKAIISSEDLALYEAIRDLSDIKENPESSPAQIEKAQKRLDEVSKNMSHISEAAELSRMNWWTAEYGLIGDLKDPKIFGAGLLSSVGESKWCLSSKVKKLPLTVDCIKTSYDITEPQPQLFVTPDFKTLGKVLKQMADSMAFSTGGMIGLKKALQSKTVNTVELNTGIQISGQLSEIVSDGSKIIYLKFTGPSQLCFKDKEIPGHNSKYHSAGYGTAVGSFTSAKLNVGENCLLTFDSGVKVQGKLAKKTDLILSFENCTVEYKGQNLFKPDWGVYDMALGQSVSSVFGGAADRLAYGESDDFVAKRVPLREITSAEKSLQQHYEKLRQIRRSRSSDQNLEAELVPLIEKHANSFPNDWLLHVEALELIENRTKNPQLKTKTLAKLNQLAEKNPQAKEVIHDGIALAHQL